MLAASGPLSGYVTRFSPYVDDASYTTRMALDAYLAGQSRSEFEADQLNQPEFNHWGPWARDPSKKATLFSERLAAYRAVEGGCLDALGRFGVRYIALPAGRDLPAPLRPRWKKVRGGKTWSLWGRADRAGASGSDPTEGPSRAGVAPGRSGAGAPSVQGSWRATAGAPSSGAGVSARPSR
jgi:hypothetical protein